jgi:heterodisulfide reductase subunit A-like polyferredoxin/siroheme synthase (precorrin-2 oxidase/ferrochelatase)
MLRVGIPKYRLPDEVIDYELEFIKKAGVEIRTSAPVSQDLTLRDLFHQGFKAIFIAIGTHKSRKLNVEGEDLEGVFHSIGFLQDIPRGRAKYPVENKAVAVIGGGHTALDTARTALRLGAREVSIIYRRSREQMPVSDDELSATEAEGIKLHYLLAPRKILGEGGKVTGLTCTRMRLGPPDLSGRREPVPVEGQSETFKIDVVITAIGQIPELIALAEDMGEFRVTREGIIPIAGVDLEGVHGFLDFLQAASLGRKVKIGNNVLVIGGGNVAIDVARVSKRLGAEKVRVVCLESKTEMPAYKEEVEDAEAEGIIFYNRRAPKRIVGRDGKAIGLETLECLSVFDPHGRFFPRIRDGSESFIEGDTIMVAIGQEVDYTLLSAADGALVTKKGFLKVDPITMQTNLSGIFAGGDAVGAGGLAIHSIAHGHQAATSIDRYLRGEDLYQGREPAPVHVAEMPARPAKKKPRVAMAKLTVKDRSENFEEVELGFTEEQAIEEANRCLNCGTCSECLQCITACKAEAIDHHMEDRLVELNAGAILIAAGCDRVDLSRLSHLGYGKYPDVVTSIQFERILSASGPYGGHIQRPSDGKLPKKVAFIQCVGSREPASGNPHCSSVCCMYAIKESVIAKEHEHEIEPTIFYMDIRAYGKDFDRYYERAKNEYGIRFKRARVSGVARDEQTGRLVLEYEDDSAKVAHEEFDLTVLSIGFQGSGRLRGLADSLGLPLNEHGFIATASHDPVQTKVPGIFICGPAQEPKDIPETVMQASAGAAAAAEVLAGSRWLEVKEKTYPPEKAVAGQPPRVGVFVCHCGINIGGTVRVPEVVEYAKSLRDVVYAEDNLYTCSQDTQAHIRDMIAEHSLNRVVVASCTPRTHEPLFQETIREAGLNRHLFEMANIRDQCSWIHMGQSAEATEKAKDLLRMAVAKVRLVEPLPVIPLDVRQSALVVGGGPAGMSAALSLANQDFAVDLVEREARLGGHLNEVLTDIDGRETSELLTRLVEEIGRHRNITVHLESQIQAVEGFVGQYKTTLLGNGTGGRQIQHGVAIIATGARESVPQGYLYGQDERIMTGLQFERLLKDRPDEGLPGRVVFIQCVGSREEGHLYCSRVCCGESVKNALVLKKRKPEAEVYVLFRDMRTYGFAELAYQEAREAGIIFLRYEAEAKPEVAIKKAHLAVSLKDIQSGEQLVIRDPEAVVLAARIDAEAGNEAMSQLFKVPLNQDGFFLEAHVKLRPVDFATEGVFLAGMAHNPKTIEEAIVQGRAAAARAATIISKDKDLAEATIAAVNEDLCDGCGICVGVCEYNALEIQEKPDGKKIVRLNEAACKGCGCCVAACPSGAMEQKGYKSEQILAEIDAALL